jgi:uncharacterized protein YkwD
MSRYVRCIILALATAMAATPAVSRSLEQDVLAEINFVRTRPYEYAQELRRYREQFDGRLLIDETGEHMTYEGVRAVDEAIHFLEAQQPLDPLEPGVILARAAADHSADQGSRGGMGHVSTNGMTPSRRVASRGGGIYVSETISYGPSDAEGIVRSLIVDDGVRSRIHRSVIFLSFLRYAGAGCGPHVSVGFMCVIDYSQTPDGRAPNLPSYARSDVGRARDRQPF